MLSPSTGEATTSKSSSSATAASKAAARVAAAKARSQQAEKFAGDLVRDIEKLPHGPTYPLIVKDSLSKSEYSVTKDSTGKPIVTGFQGRPVATDYKEIRAFFGNSLFGESVHMFQGPSLALSPRTAAWRVLVN
jgi:hypothetical protein